MTNTTIQQNNEKIKENRCISNLKSEGGVAKYMAVEILLESNELASDILAANGFVLIDEDGFAKYDDVWKFYGVAERYFAGVLQRNWISSRGTPEDIHKNPHTNTFTISARMSLALCAIMYAGRNIPEESKVMQVYESLKGTRYYNRAEKKTKAVEKAATESAKKRLAALSFVEKALSDDVETVEIAPNGRVLISLSGLAKLVSYLTDTYNVTESKVDEKSENKRGINGSIAVTATKDGVTQRFNSMTECAKHIGSNAGTISAAACVPNRKVHGYEIAYA